MGGPQTGKLPRLQPEGELMASAGLRRRCAPFHDREGPSQRTIRRPGNRVVVSVGASILVLTAILWLWQSPAFSAPDNGPAAVTESDCLTDSFGTFCYRTTSVSNTTLTPSGNKSFTSNTTMKYTFTGAGDLAGCSSEGFFNREYHSLYKDGTPHEVSNFGHGRDRGDCFDVVFVCAHTDQWHYTNGSVQIDRWIDSCG